MKKMFCILLTLIIVSTGICAVRINDSIKEADRIQKGIADSIIRFHVRANSDSNVDQSIKLDVKEAVVDYIRPKLENSSTLEESRAILESETDAIREVAINTLRDNGSDLDVSVYFENCYFPVKSYGDVTFPAGEYEAFRIDIGEAEGKNWWCVLYPPLCFVDTTFGVVPEESKEKLAGVLTEKEYSQITAKDCKIRCKYLTFLNKYLKDW